MRWARHRARIGETGNAYKLLVGKTEWKRLCGRSRRRWEDNTRMDLKEMGWKVVDSIHLAQDRGQWRALVNTGVNLGVP